MGTMMGILKRSKDLRSGFEGSNGFVAEVLNLSSALYRLNEHKQLRLGIQLEASQTLVVKKMAV